MPILKIKKIKNKGHNPYIAKNALKNRMHATSLGFHGHFERFADLNVNAPAINKHLEISNKEIHKSDDDDDDDDDFNEDYDDDDDDDTKTSDYNYDENEDALFDNIDEIKENIEVFGTSEEVESILKRNQEAYEKATNVIITDKNVSFKIQAPIEKEQNELMYQHQPAIKSVIKNLIELERDFNPIILKNYQNDEENESSFTQINKKILELKHKSNKLKVEKKSYPKISFIPSVKKNDYNNKVQSTSQSPLQSHWKPSSISPSKSNTNKTNIENKTNMGEKKTKIWQMSRIDSKRNEIYKPQPPIYTIQSSVAKQKNFINRQKNKIDTKYAPPPRQEIPIAKYLDITPSPLVIPDLTHWPTKGTIWSPKPPEVPSISKSVTSILSNHTSKSIIKVAHKEQILSKVEIQNIPKQQSKIPIITDETVSLGSGLEEDSIIHCKKPKKTVDSKQAWACKPKTPLSSRPMSGNKKRTSIINNNNENQKENNESNISQITEVSPPKRNNTFLTKVLDSEIDKKIIELRDELKARVNDKAEEKINKLLETNEIENKTINENKINIFGNLMISNKIKIKEEEYKEKDNVPEKLTELTSQQRKHRRVIMGPSGNTPSIHENEKNNIYSSDVHHIRGGVIKKTLLGGLLNTFMDKKFLEIERQKALDEEERLNKLDELNKFIHEDVMDEDILTREEIKDNKLISYIRARRLNEKEYLENEQIFDKEIQPKKGTSEEINLELAKKREKQQIIDCRWNLTLVMEDLLNKDLSENEINKQNYTDEIVLLFNGFCEIDYNKDGFISLIDLSSFFESYNLKISEIYIKEKIWALDDNVRGILTFEDIKRYFVRLRSKFVGLVEKNRLDLINRELILEKKEKENNIKKKMMIKHVSNPNINNDNKDLLSDMKTRPHSAATTRSKRLMWLFSNNNNHIDNHIDNDKYNLSPTSSPVTTISSPTKIIAPTPWTHLDDFSVESSDESILVKKTINKTQVIDHLNRLYSSNISFESPDLYRILMFAALQNVNKKVHLFTAYEVYIKTF
jgi:hypothetical protein